MGAWRGQGGSKMRTTAGNAHSGTLPGWTFRRKCRPKPDQAEFVLIYVRSGIRASSPQAVSHSRRRHKWNATVRWPMGIPGVCWRKVWMSIAFRMFLPFFCCLLLHSFDYLHIPCKPDCMFKLWMSREHGEVRCGISHYHVVYALEWKKKKRTLASGYLEKSFEIRWLWAFIWAQIPIDSLNTLCLSLN